MITASGIPSPEELPGTDPFFVKYNGSVTVQSHNGRHVTFRIRNISDSSDFAPGSRIVEILYGPNNEHDYKGIGFVSKDRTKIHVWDRYRETAHEQYLDLLLRKPLWESRGMVYLEEKRCRRCGRKLTTPESVRTGLGPECEKKERRSNAAAK